MHGSASRRLRRRHPNQRHKTRHIHIAARQRDPHPPATKRLGRVHQRGQRTRARRFEHDIHSLEDEAHRVDDAAVGHGQDITNQALDHFERLAPHCLGLLAVADGARHLDADDAPAAQRLLHVVAALQIGRAHV